MIRRVLTTDQRTQPWAKASRQSTHTIQNIQRHQNLETCPQKVKMQRKCLDCQRQAIIYHALNTFNKGMSSSFKKVEATRQCVSVNSTGGIVVVRVKFYACMRRRSARVYRGIYTGRPTTTATHVWTDLRITRANPHYLPVFSKQLKCASDLYKWDPINRQCSDFVICAIERA